MRIKAFFISFLILYVLGFSQNNVPAKPKLPTSNLPEIVLKKAKNTAQATQFSDSLTIFPKTLNQNYREKYKGQEFDYHTVKPRESLWERLKKRLVKLMESIFGKMDPNSASKYALNFMRLIAILVVGFVLYLIIRYLVSKNGNFLFGKKNRKINIQSNDLHENIHEIDFNERIAKFENNKDFRSAIRYHFLSVLKKLNDQKILEWNPKKTNKDYIAELKNPSIKERFRDLVYIFDYVWYGEFFIDENSYQIFKRRFLDFKN